jgi:hypothetical protein
MIKKMRVSYINELVAEVEAIKFLIGGHTHEIT